MKVIIEMSPSEAVMLNDHVNDLLLAASNEEMKQTTQLEAPKTAKTAKKRMAQKQDEEAAPHPAPLPVPEPVIVPATQPVPTAVPIQAAVAAPAPIPTAAPRVFTRPEIAAASAQLRDAGRLEDLKALLAEFGVQALTDLNAAQLQTFAHRLVSMGAKL